MLQRQRTVCFKVRYHAENFFVSNRTEIDKRWNDIMMQRDIDISSMECSKTFLNVFSLYVVIENVHGPVLIWIWVSFIMYERPFAAAVLNTNTCLPFSLVPFKTYTCIVLFYLSLLAKTSDGILERCTLEHKKTNHCVIIFIWHFQKTWGN